MDVDISGLSTKKTVAAMIDSGATGVFISAAFVRRNNVVTKPLKHPIVLYNIDGTLNKAGTITHVARLRLQVGSFDELVEFLVTNISTEDVILGIPWLREVNPQINWREGKITFNGEPEEVLPEDGNLESPFQKIGGTRKLRREWKKRGVLEDVSEELWCCAGVTYSTQLAAQAHQTKAKKTFEEMVPEAYRDFAKVFSEAESERLPEHRPWDHAIDLKPDAPEMLRAKVYPMPVNEQAELDKFLEENLRKGYIVPSKSPLASPVFFVKKKDGKLRMVQDYRKLNDITIKNRYPLPLATDIINRLRQAKYFTKFDVRWGYNNIRIKEGDEWKAAFVTNRGLYEPKVMFFGLTNSPATFQSLMNSIFVDLVAAGKVAVYLDDILIYSTDLEEHRTIVCEVLRRLEEHDLFL